jgi:hypothetical protein
VSSFHCFILQRRHHLHLFLCILINNLKFLVFDIMLLLKSDQPTAGEGEHERLIEDVVSEYMNQEKKSWRMFGERGINRFWWRVILAALVLCGLALIGSLVGVLIPERRHSPPHSKDGCPGYAASNIAFSFHGMTADLTLAGPTCNTYGDDLEDLKLEVEYQTGIGLLSKCA